MNDTPTPVDNARQELCRKIERDCANLREEIAAQRSLIDSLNLLLKEIDSIKDRKP